VVESDIQKAVSSAAAAAAAASKSGFTTISAINNLSGSVKPNSPNEFKDYVLV
jgi:hypothetical protein